MSIKWRYTEKQLLRLAEAFDKEIWDTLAPQLDPNLTQQQFSDLYEKKFQLWLLYHAKKLQQDAHWKAIRRANGFS